MGQYQFLKEVFVISPRFHEAQVQERKAEGVNCAVGDNRRPQTAPENNCRCAIDEPHNTCSNYTDRTLVAMCGAKYYGLKNHSARPCDARIAKGVGNFGHQKAAVEELLPKCGKNPNEWHDMEIKRKIADDI
jgi:hypothetical protein